MSRGLIIFRAAAVFVGLGVIVFLGPGFGRTLRPPPQRILDFFQEWASARNYWNGLPIYTPQEVTARRYLGFEPPNRPYFLLRYNGHPPTSVLLALPFAWLDYSDAFLAWNLLSLVCFAVSIVLVFRNLGVRFPAWGIIPGLALLLFCNPFRQQTLQGQLNLVLLLLLTGVWVADRDGRRVLAGILLGTATCLKLFPGFLFLYFLLKRRWAAVAAGAGTVAALTGVTGLVLGWDAYRDYAQIVIPELARYRGQWTNVSLLGFWEKLFGMGHRTIPLWPSPLVAHAGYLASSLLVTGLAVSAIVRARTPAAGDGAFGLSLVAMVLVSPIAWDHYFLMLLLPVTLVGQRLPTSWSYRLTFALCLLIGWLTPLLYWQRLIPGLTLDNWMTLTADPAQVITALSFPTYALLGLFVLCSALGESEAPDGAAEGVGGGGVSTDPDGQFPGEGAAPAVEPGADAGSETEMVV
ncbi:MAG: glycosyltransferase family 87 protein, partial [Gemmataceae bacterium]|nr:glycosyltransferase family 87 protein [Gemmataceae bacterium]